MDVIVSPAKVLDVRVRDEQKNLNNKPLISCVSKVSDSAGKLRFRVFTSPSRGDRLRVSS